MLKFRTILIILPFLVIGLAVWGFGKSKPAGIESEGNTSVPAMDEQLNDEGEVQISVEPQGISADSSTWNFKVTMDTHSVELAADLMKVSQLTVDDGGVFDPLVWEGDPIGGHHRSGVLKFPAVTPLPRTIELHIRGVGGVKERLFFWTL